MQTLQIRSPKNCNKCEVLKFFVLRNNCVAFIPCSRLYTHSITYIYNIHVVLSKAALTTRSQWACIAHIGINVL